MNEKPAKKGMPLWVFMVVTVSMLAVAVALLGGFWYVTTSKTKKLEREAETLRIEKEQLELDKEEAELRSQEALEEAKRVAAHNKQQEVLAQLHAATNSLVSLLQEVRVIREQAEDLKSNDTGKRLAQFPELAGRARLFYDQNLPELAADADIISRLEGVRRSEDQIQSSLNTPAMPPPDVSVAAQNANNWSERNRDTAKRVQSILTSLEREARVRVSETPIDDSSPTLTDAMDRLTQVETAVAQELFLEETAEAKKASAITEAEAAAAEIIKEAEMKAAERLAAVEIEEAELERRLAEEDAQQRVEDAESQAAIDEKMTEAERIALRQRASDPETLNKLTAFVSPGAWQPGQGVTLTDGPMSYSAIEKAGALVPTIKGLEKLVRIATNPRDNNRPRWSRGYWKKTDEKRERYAEAQRLLIELGPTLVELGKLAP